MKTIGIIGGGQLGMMLAIEIHKLNHRAICLDPNPKCPASYVCDETIVSEYNDINGLTMLGEKSDIITYEFENVKAEPLKFIKDKYNILQGIEPLFDSQNRIREKENAIKHGLTPPKFFRVMSLDDLFSQIKDGEVLDLNIIVKADVQGTAEAVKASLEKIDVEGVRVNVIRSTAGGISESDVLLATASKAIIYGFNVRPNAKVRQKAEEEGIEIRLHNIIYKMVEEIETAMKGMLAPEIKEVITGQAEIRQVIKVSKVGNIAGCYVTDGFIRRNCGVRLIRDGVVVYEGKLGSLKRFQDDVKEVTSGFECGLSIENFNDIKEGDIVEGYIMEEVEVK